MRKVKVKMLDSIAGLADPKPTADLDQKYKDKIAAMNKGREKPFSETFVKNFTDEMKKHDRYGEKPIGFVRDWAFKIGDEVMLPIELAQKWEESGTCVILEDLKKAA